MKPFALRWIAAVTVTLSNTNAVDSDWNGSTDTNWLTPANWTPAGPPTGGAGNFARFATPGANPPTISANIPDVEGFLTGAGGIVITQTAGTANLIGSMRMGGLSGAGVANVGTYNISGGTLQANTYRITEAAGHVATVNVSGNGIFRQRDVTITDPLLYSRLGLNGTANVDLSGTGAMSFDSRVILGEGTGVVNFTQTGGTFEVRRGEFALGDTYSVISATPTANYNISGGTLRATSAPSPTIDTAGNIVVGRWSNSNAKLTVSGTATVRANQDLLIADIDPSPGMGDASAKGELVQTGGNISFGGQFIAGRGRSGTNFGDGIYNMSGGTLMQDNVDPANVANHNHIGMGGTGTFTISHGTASFNARTLVGSITGGIGTVTQSGGLFEVRNDELIIGELGTGTYNISNGTVQTLGTRPINVGNANNGTGNLNVSGTGVVIAGRDMNVGNGGTNSRGTVTQTGGTVRVNGILRLANVSTSTGTYNLSGGTLDLNNGNIDHGPGVFAFFFTGGRLQNANTIILPLTQQGGVLAPGPDGRLGTTHVEGPYSLNAGGTLEINVELYLADRLITNQNSTVTLAGSLDLVRAPNLLPGSAFQILSNNSANPIVGTFAGRPDDTQFFEDGAVWSIDYQAGDGNDVLLTCVVPEPGSTGLVVAGLVGGALRRGRRQSV